MPAHDVNLVTGDSDVVPEGGGTHSDRSIRLGGFVMVKASEQIIDTVEANQVAGNQVINLNELGTQNYLPTANLDGSSTFIDSGSVTNLQNQSVNFDGEVVIGVHSATVRSDELEIDCP